MLVLRVAFRASQDSGASLIAALHDAWAAVTRVVCLPTPSSPHHSAADEPPGRME